MTHKVFVFSLIAYPLLVLAYLFCYSQFYAAIRDQKPDWIKYKGEPSIFYIGLPRRFDPNVSLRALCIAFTSRAAQLDSSGYSYAQAIRIILPISIAIFGFILWFIMSKA